MAKNKSEDVIELDPKRYIVSKTDKKGFITYVNDYFSEISGYSPKELLGAPHNIVRHPDMPRVAFKLMWEAIQAGKDFGAIVKNRAKDGRAYWVFTRFETQYHPSTGEIVGYVAYRKAAPKKGIETIAPLYEKLVEYEKIGGMEASEKFLNDVLADNKMTYEEYINEIVGYKGLFKVFFDMMKKLFGNK